MNPACQNFRRALAPALDHELPPAQQLEFDAHRAICGECADFLRIETAFNQFLKENLAAGPLPDRVDAGIKRTLRGARRADLLRASGGGLAALLMVGLVSYGSVRLFAHPGRGTGLALPGELAGGSFPLSFSPSLSPSAQPISTRLPAPATLRGRLVCVHCLLSERYHLQSDCLHQGHRGALLLNDGTLVFFMDGTDEKLRRPDGTQNLLEQQVEIEGDYAPGEKFVKVRNYHLVNS